MHGKYRRSIQGFISIALPALLPNARQPDESSSHRQYPAAGALFLRFVDAL